MHISSGRWLYGLFLALLTALLWGVLPIKLKEVLQVMDPVTVTWYRLLVSGSILLAYLAASGGLPRFRPLGRKGGGLLALAIAGLSANYVLYLMGLSLLSPGTTQLVIQVAPILLLISSLLIFRERFSLAQGIGLAVLLLGFGLFFNQRLAELLTSLTTYTAGVLIVLLAALVWTFYGLAQKQLLTVWNSLQVMMVIYLACALLLTPWAQPLQVVELSALQGWLLFACCLNTLVAYGAFAEALAHWEASRVSAALAITPLITFGSVALAATWWPEHVQPEQINWIAYGGAALVVLGSALTAIGPLLMASLRARRVRVAAQSREVAPSSNE
jgi:drug/metabolite transporter (DMT)-like permease